MKQPLRPLHSRNGAMPGNAGNQCRRGPSTPRCGPGLRVEHDVDAGGWNRESDARRWAARGIDRCGQNDAVELFRVLMPSSVGDSRKRSVEGSASASPGYGKRRRRGAAEPPTSSIQLDLSQGGTFQPGCLSPLQYRRLHQLARARAASAGDQRYRSNRGSYLCSDGRRLDSKPPENISHADDPGLGERR